MLSVLILSAGNSTRMGGGNKQLLLIDNVPVVVRSVNAFKGIPEVSEIFVAVKKEDKDIFDKLFIEDKDVKVIATGGETRQSTVKQSLEYISDKSDYIAIHDGARPLVRKEDILNTIKACKEVGGAVLGAMVKDTVKIIENSLIKETPDRSTLFCAQTPQMFNLKEYKKAFDYAEKLKLDFTDDSQLFEKTGRKVASVIGHYDNIKITTPEDVLIAEALFKGETNMIRIGQGYDVHRLIEGRKLILGGVTIPYEKGLLGHSDADVLTHAIMDALLGALALGDIGAHFPDTDPAYKGANSMELLKKVVLIIKDKGYIVGNLDCTVAAQAPKLKPYILEMRKNLAEVMGVDVSSVSVKATTEEGMGITGNGEGMTATAVCVLSK